MNTYGYYGLWNLRKRYGVDTGASSGYQQTIISDNKYHKWIIGFPPEEKLIRKSYRGKELHIIFHNASNDHLNKCNYDFALLDKFFQDFECKIHIYVLGKLPRRVEHLIGRNVKVYCRPYSYVSSDGNASRRIIEEVINIAISMINQTVDIEEIAKKLLPEPEKLKFIEDIRGIDVQANIPREALEFYARHLWRCYL